MFYKSCLAKSGRSFGTLLNQTGSTDNDYLFTGEQYDSELDNYYLSARYYDRSVGRFTQMDTYQGRMGEPLTLHKYMYTHADPINIIDPTGHFSIASTVRALDAAASLASRASVAVDVFSSTMNSEEVTPQQVGMATLVGMSSSAKLVKLFAKKLCSKIRCIVPILDDKHIFHGEIKRRTAQGFHSTAIVGTQHSAGSSHVSEVLWKKPNGVYKAWVNVADYKTGRFRRKKSTMFPDSWSRSAVGASLYLGWLKNRAKSKGTLNMGVVKVQYYVKDGIWLQGHPLR
ncbi:EndoU domain-containing protein [Aestuariibacter sp. AA17]|uniref:EndoU domain-containing protein n=1 Tax=Fluctibacter corallii TaxID=2984329 RepID=A0ABT3AA02_9ALTE|nr:RHS repeat-associated core domain-containing protein [Aestuariibacter sp. AA17]MCV2885505.1 EndoU domain-containing protein [Aestuariibacter sp. AA17]